MAKKSTKGNKSSAQREKAKAEKAYKERRLYQLEHGYNESYIAEEDIKFKELHGKKATKKNINAIKALARSEKGYINLDYGEVLTPAEYRKRKNRNKAKQKEQEQTIDNDYPSFTDIVWETAMRAIDSIIDTRGYEPSIFIGCNQMKRMWESLANKVGKENAAKVISAMSKDDELAYNKILNGYIEIVDGFTEKIEDLSKEILGEDISLSMNHNFADEDNSSGDEYLDGTPYDGRDEYY